MKTWYFRCLNICLLLLIALHFCVTQASAQVLPGEGTDSGLGGANIISGNVYGPTGEKLMRRMSVRLETMTRGPRSGMTNDDGVFIFRNIPNGSYTVVIDKEKEFEPFSQVVDVMALRGSPPQTITLSIRLKAKEGVSLPRPSSVSSEFADVPPPALEHYKKAIEFGTAGKFKEAINEFKQAVDKHPEFMLAYSEMGVYHMRLNEFDEADKAFQSALKIKPDALIPLLNRGMNLVTMRRFEDAEPVLRKALQQDEKSPVGHYFLGMALANQGKFEEADKELNIALKTGDPGMKEGHRVLAIIYNQRGDKKSTVEQLEAYLKLDPNAADAEQLKARITQLKQQIADEKKSTNN